MHAKSAVSNEIGYARTDFNEYLVTQLSLQPGTSGLHGELILHQ